MKQSKSGLKFELTQADLDALNERFKAWIESKDSMILLDFCHKEKITRARLQQVCARDEKLQETYRRAMDHTERLLVKGGLLNKFNAGFSKFILQSKYDYKTTEIHRHEGPAAPIIKENDGKSKDLTIKDKFDE